MRLHGRFYKDEDVKVEFVKADDIDIRTAAWKNGKNGTVFIFNGRSEFIEKYFNPINAFKERGFAVVTHDWRGQGLSTRTLSEEPLGHIDNFAEYQADIDAVYHHFKDMPRPHILFCHSMGGAIGLRALINGLPMDRVIFHAPMWEINAPWIVKKCIPLISWLTQKLNLYTKLLIGSDKKPFEEVGDPDNHSLTHNKDLLFEIIDLLQSQPKLQTWGPTFGWSLAAIDENNEVRDLPSPEIETLVFWGEEERIVDNDAIKERLAKSPSFTGIELAEARHEAYIERLDIQEKLWFHIDEFLKDLT